MIKLYKRVGVQTCYWEAWEQGGRVVFHSGVVGDMGQTSEHSVGRFTSCDLMVREANKRRAEGYEEIALEDHRLLVVQYQSKDEDPAKDLEKRRKVEDLLNESLGWTGNGHCDGGDIGSGTINIFSFVIDPFLASDVVVEALRKAKLLGGAIIALEDEDGFQILWPQDFAEEFAYWY